MCGFVYLIIIRKIANDDRLVVICICWQTVVLSNLTTKFSNTIYYSSTNMMEMLQSCENSMTYWRSSMRKENRKKNSQKKERNSNSRGEVLFAPTLWFFYNEILKVMKTNKTHKNERVLNYIFDVIQFRLSHQKMELWCNHLFSILESESSKMMCFNVEKLNKRKLW